MPYSSIIIQHIRLVKYRNRTMLLLNSRRLGDADYKSVRVQVYVQPSRCFTLLVFLLSNQPVLPLLEIIDRCVQEIEMRTVRLTSKTKVNWLAELYATVEWSTFNILWVV